MSDFTWEPTESEPERPERRRPPRLVSTGLHPTATTLPTTRAKDAAPCYRPCEACGTPVVLGTTPTGQRVAVEVQTLTYILVWHGGTATPLLYASRGYPVHTCVAGRKEEAWQTLTRA